ncbi:hypothetical protein IX317_000606 [Fusobacterium sp. DD29]|uniref:hypothetical protein n=1 Tax=unclassified Fusobacterium TaxID=2648384 RepID=UPI001B8D672F|nr:MULTISPECIES: hypothetical protein [unclassified Fusobacterium]MBR8700272.1 hypothetical protein [Fusobacterium sp. DD45]MBR8710473.1 hypothetical protein [Fusobacterium sp. DD28]MBR8748945.1 hypothetical protein [Fusobacterium sp. DD29]MBR8751077.1 hypothetical protein [Fusobacterium sp. DD26]MBR8761251.1 hypothetical protein [Fusobacterium sp. DD25]
MKAKKVIEVTREDLAEFYSFTYNNGIFLNCDEIYNNSLYLNGTPCNCLSWGTEKELASDEVLKLVVKMLNVLVLSDHELIFKEEEN